MGFKIENSNIDTKLPEIKQKKVNLKENDLFGIINLNSEKPKTTVNKNMHLNKPFSKNIFSLAPLKNHNFKKLGEQENLDSMFIIQKIDFSSNYEYEIEKKKLPKSSAKVNTRKKFNNNEESTPKYNHQKNLTHLKLITNTNNNLILPETKLQSNNIPNMQEIEFNEISSTRKIKTISGLNYKATFSPLLS